MQLRQTLINRELEKHIFELAPKLTNSKQVDSAGHSNCPAIGPFDNFFPNQKIIVAILKAKDFSVADMLCPSVH